MLPVYQSSMLVNPKQVAFMVVKKRLGRFWFYGVHFSEGFYLVPSRQICFRKCVCWLIRDHAYAYAYAYA